MGLPSSYADEKVGVHLDPLGQEALLPMLVKLTGKAAVPSDLLLSCVEFKNLTFEKLVT